MRLGPLVLKTSAGLHKDLDSMSSFAWNFAGTPEYGTLEKKVQVVERHKLFPVLVQLVANLALLDYLKCSTSMYTRNVVLNEKGERSYSPPLDGPKSGYPELAKISKTFPDVSEGIPLVLAWNQYLGMLHYEAKKGFLQFCSADLEDVNSRMKKYSKDIDMMSRVIFKEKSS